MDRLSAGDVFRLHLSAALDERSNGARVALICRLVQWCSALRITYRKEVLASIRPKGKRAMKKKAMKSILVPRAS